ncbi:MAG TPA: hypothetical protein VM144_18150 [Aestuariivirga sp.]|nr:hypothetical protein [Aestuariivirga sp.]
MRNPSKRWPAPRVRGPTHSELGGEEYSRRVDWFLEESAALRGQVEAERRLSPDQEAELLALAERLGIEPPLDADYQIFRELWAAENNEQVYLVPREVPIPLRPEELCCFSEQAVWRQPDPHPSSAGLSRFSMAFPLTKLASYRISGISSRHRPLDSTREMATGSLHITNLKLFFDSGSLSTTITFNGLANIECYANAIEVGKCNGRSDFFQMTRLSSEYAYMIVQELNRLR